METIELSWANWIEDFKKTNLTPSLQSTLELFKKYKSIPKVAEEKCVKVETIERQIHILLVKALLHIDDVVSKNHQQTILNVLETQSISSLSSIKDFLPDEITYFEIKAVICSIQQKPKTI
jgi:ATP-dependent DNA helicase RecQ